MSSLLERPLHERAARLDSARDSLKPLLSNSVLFQNKCESVFSEFRISCVHLRREPATLDAVQEKFIAWRYLCKLCRERPFLHDRVNEVLKILVLSDAWMQAFVEDPECNVEDLPPDLQEDFRRRAEEANDPSGTKEAGGYPSQSPSLSSSGPIKLTGSMQVVVQRCTKARLLVDERAGRWSEIASGLFVAVSFTKHATEEKVAPAARFILSAKLSTASAKPGGEAESLASLCSRGLAQGLLVLPQASLQSEVHEKDLNLTYAAQSNSERLYNAFVQAVHSAASELIAGPQKTQLQIIAGEFQGSQVMDISSAGPFMHSFTV